MFLGAKVSVLANVFLQIYGCFRGFNQLMPTTFSYCYSPNLRNTKLIKLNFKSMTSLCSINLQVSKV